MAKGTVLVRHGQEIPLNITVGGKTFIRLGSGEYFKYRNSVGTTDYYVEYDLEANTSKLDWLHTAAQEIKSLTDI